MLGKQWESDMRSVSKGNDGFNANYPQKEHTHNITIGICRVIVIVHFFTAQINQGLQDQTHVETMDRCCNFVCLMSGLVGLVGHT